MARTSAWNRSVLLLLLAVAVYFQSWSDLWPYWENKDATYTHGTLIAAIAIWLVWRARPTLVGVDPAPTRAALPVILLLSAAWLVAARGNVFIVHAMLWPLLAFALLWAGVGWRAASRLAFPLGLLYFAIPFWDYFKPPLQAISAFMVSIFTGAAGIPAHIDGPFVMLPDATIFIALDCSGAHFLSVALAVGALAVNFRGDGLRTGALIMVLAGLLSMVFNWLRIFLIVLAYLHPDLRHTLETMGHLTFGWWVFVLDLVAFTLVLRLVPFSGKPHDAAQPLYAQHAAARGAAGPALAAATALLLPVSSWAAHLAQSYPAKPAVAMSLPGLAGPIAPDPRWQPHFEGAAWEHRAAYMGTNGRIVELYRNEYHEQAQGSELIAQGASLFDPAVFTTRAAHIVRLSSADVSPLEASTVELQDKSGRKWTARYAYLVGDDVVASASRAQVLTALHSLYGRPTAGILSVMMPCVPDCESVGGNLDAAMIVVHETYREARMNHE
jgi:exosortase